MRNRFAPACFIVSAAVAGPALATPVALVNPNFDVAGDSDFVTDGSVTNGVTGYVGTIDLFGDFAFYGSNFNGGFVITDAASNPSGSNLLIRNARVTTEPAARVSVAAGDTATFTFDGVLESAGTGILAAIDFFDSTGSTLASASDTFTLGNATGIANQQLGLSVTGVAPAGAASLGLRVEGTDGVQTFRVDNFRLDVVPIPEPAALTLALMGGAALLGRRRRAVA